MSIPSPPVGSGAAHGQNATLAAFYQGGRSPQQDDGGGTPPFSADEAWRETTQGRLGQYAARLTGVDLGGMQGSNDSIGGSLVGTQNGSPVFDFGAFGDVAGGLGEI
jgi:hypothetical protein